MKTGMMKQAIALIALSAVALLTSCAPQSQSGNSSYLNSGVRENSNIIGGSIADSQFQKANGIVQLRIITLFGEATCTGSLIARNIVLTAAHCIADETLRGVAVLFSLSDVNVPEAQVLYAVAGAVHPKYGPTEDDQAVWNDVALLKLEKDAPEDFQLAQLPTAKPNLETQKVEISPSIEKDAKLTLAGFGITNAIVRKVIKNKKGKEVVVELPSSGTGTLRHVSDILVTAVTDDQKEISLDQSNYRGACHGDSGGPALLLQEDGTYVQVGVTSRGTEKLGNCNKGAIYTGLAGHLDWITKVSEQLQKEQPAKDQPADPKPTEPIAAN